MRFAVTVEHIAAVSFGSHDGCEFAQGGEGLSFHVGNWFPDGHR